MGFEPTRLSPAELKSAPLDRSGIRAFFLHRARFELARFSPSELESDPLDRSGIYASEKILLPCEGLEPSATRLKAVRSTNWANRAL